MKTQGWGLTSGQCGRVATDNPEFTTRVLDPKPVPACTAEYARFNYVEARSNGETSDSPERPFPGDGRASPPWVKGTYETATYYTYEVRYYEGQGDKAWMEERDRNYVFRLELEGKLDTTEPNLRTEVPKLYEAVVAMRRLRQTRSDDMEAVDKILKGSPLMEVCPHGEVIIYVAAAVGHLSVMEWLLTAGAEVNREEKAYGRTPLYFAAEKGHLPVVERLLKAWAEVDKTNTAGETPLFAAARNGHLPVVDYLLRVGAADVDKESTAGISPLFVAAQNGHTAVFNRLLEAHADINRAEKTNGLTQLCLAAQNGLLPVVEQLLAAGADIDRASAKERLTPLMAAACKGHLAVVRVLHAAGANGDIKDAAGKTALKWAREQKHAEIVDFLVSPPPRISPEEHARLELETRTVVPPPGKREIPVSIVAPKPPVSLIEIPDSCLCPITREPMIDPVTTAAGQTYERRMIEEWLKTHDTDPNTRITLTSKELTPNYTLKGTIDKLQAQLPAIQKMQIEAARRRLEETGYQEVIRAREADVAKYKDLAETKERERIELTEKLKQAEETARAKEKVVATHGLQLIPYRNLTYGPLRGQGGFCEVFEGQWQGTKVAIKELLAKGLSDDSKKEFDRETGIWGGLSHPNIVQLYGVSTDNPQHYSMVMELMPLGSLYQVLHNGKPLGWEVRFHIAQDVAAGLTHLHEQEILHCDLKSMNVLLDGTMRAKLTDFGLSKVKLETKTTTAGTSKGTGTIRWMAPELFKRGGKASKESDIYSFGMVLWEIASRKTPYEDAPDDTIAMGWIKDGEKDKIPEDCQKTYPSYAALIGRCWEERTARPTTQDAAKVLMALSDAEAVETQKSSVPRR